MSLVYATREQAKAAYEQFAAEPDPPQAANISASTMFPAWEDLDAETKALWHRVATAAINSRIVGTG